MKKSASKGTKHATKSLPVNNKKETLQDIVRNSVNAHLKQPKAKSKKGSRGGARPGAGRARYVGPMKPFNCDLPEVMLEEISGLDIGNKTEYIAQLILGDFQKRGVKKTTLSKIEEALEKKKN